MDYTQFLERIKQHFGFRSDSDVEKAVNVGGGYCWKVKKGKINYPDAIVNWLKEQNLNVDYFMTGNGQPNLSVMKDEVLHVKETLEGRMIPFLDQKASAGPGKQLLDTDQKCRLIRVPESVSDIPNLAALEVAGDSMYPTLSDGDIVICDSAGWSGDGIYVLRNHDSEFVKRVVLTPAGYNVISDNALYPPYACRTEDTEVVGRVHAAVVRVK